jgi:LmbE family N-acetylglucosaminyl deacetylase
MARRSNREKAAGLAGWLGFGGGARPLTGRVVVLSPHLDDAVLSLGAAVAHGSRHGAEITVVTVLAGEPGSAVPAGEWDAAAGFATAGEATRARRAEDARACELVGARPVWLDFCDHQYPRGGSDDDVWAALVPELAAADSILAPGFPLLHEDHAWLLALVEQRLGADPRLARYVEQPYAAAWTGDEPHGEWTPVAAGPRDRLTKLRACRAYPTQLALLGRDSPVLSRLVRYEGARGGERIRWA